MSNNMGNVSSDQRLFTMVYHDFLDSDILDGKEKIIYILLKRHLEFGKDSGNVFPGIKTLMKQSGMSNKTITNIIKSLKEKGILQVKRRGLNKPNLYTLFDYAGIWKSKSKDEILQAIEDTEIKNATELLQENGFEVIKKELKSETDQSTDLNPKQSSNLITTNNTAFVTNSQESKAFSRDMINEIYDFDILKKDREMQIDTFDSLLELILEILNSTAKTTRVNGEDKPTEIVKSRFLKLNYSHLEYVVDEFEKQTNSVRNKRAYLITSLFNSYTTIDFHYINKVQNDLNK